MPLPRLAWPARAASPPGVVQRSGQRVGAGIIEQVLRKDRLQGVAAVEIVARLVGLVGLVAACAVLGERAGGRGAAAAIAQHRLMPSSNWETGIRFDASTLHGASPPPFSRSSPRECKTTGPEEQAQRSRPNAARPRGAGPQAQVPPGAKGLTNGQNHASTGVCLFRGHGPCPLVPRHALPPGAGGGMAVAGAAAVASQPQPRGVPHLPFLSPPSGAPVHPAAGLPSAPGADRPWGAPQPSLQQLDGESAAPLRLGTGGVVRPTDGRRRPTGTPREGWLSDGRRVLHFRPSRWNRWSQLLEVTSGELLPDQSVPLLKRRLELDREQALRLWQRKRQQGWSVCAPQWSVPPGDAVHGR